MMEQLDFVYSVPTLAEYNFGVVSGGAASEIAKPSGDKPEIDDCMNVPVLGE